tara:strand:- start:298 stop:615 length:318 start_codon:yes stop_codon:yes gene_type:complete
LIGAIVLLLEPRWRIELGIPKTRDIPLTIPLTRTTLGPWVKLAMAYWSILEIAQLYRVMISIGGSNAPVVPNSAPVDLLRVNAAQRNAPVLRLNAPALVSNIASP